MDSIAAYLREHRFKPLFTDVIQVIQVIQGSFRLVFRRPVLIAQLPAMAV
jgi:hypothetical protein